MAGHIFLLNNKYRILREIGKGGSSRVYLCEDVTLHKKWAVKKIDKTVKDRDNGIYFLSKLSHPSIPRVVECFSDKANNYFVTDHIEGKNLAEVIKDGKLRYREVLRIITDLCDVLTYLHGLDPPVIFRDLKPENIMIGDDKRTHLVDFDTVYISGDRKCSPFIFSKGFSPPEFRSEKCYPESDIYSLGKVIAAISDDKAKRKLKGIIRKACSTRKEERYHSAGEIKKELSFALLVSTGRRGMILTGIALFLLLVFILLMKDISEGPVGVADPEEAAYGEGADTGIHSVSGGENKAGGNGISRGEGRLSDRLYTAAGVMYLKGSFTKDGAGRDPARALMCFSEASDDAVHIESLRMLAEAMCIPGGDISWVRTAGMIEEGIRKTGMIEEGIRTAGVIEEGIALTGGQAEKTDESLEGDPGGRSFVDEYGLEITLGRFICANERRLMPYMKDPEDAALGLFISAAGRGIDDACLDIGRIYFDRYMESGKKEDRDAAKEMLLQAEGMLQTEGMLQQAEGILQQAEQDAGRESVRKLLKILEREITYEKGLPE